MAAVVKVLVSLRVSLTDQSPDEDMGDVAWSCVGVGVRIARFWIFIQEVVRCSCACAYWGITFFFLTYLTLLSTNLKVLSVTNGAQMNSIGDRSSDAF